jgi:hypothetical protein
MRAFLVFWKAAVEAPARSFLGSDSLQLIEGKRGRQREEIKKRTQPQFFEPSSLLPAVLF